MRNRKKYIKEHMEKPLLLQLCQYPATRRTGDDASIGIRAVAFLCCEHSLVQVTQCSEQEEICLKTVSIKFVYNHHQMLLLFALSISQNLDSRSMIKQGRRAFARKCS